jgi:hypothetical protein
VTERVVDVLEAVEVEAMNSEASAGSQPGEPRLDLLSEKNAVR